MRILQLCSLTTFGGGERHVVDLARTLNDLGHDVYAAAVSGSKLWAELSFLDRARLFALSRLNYVKNVAGLAGFVRAHDIEIVHAHAARDYHLASMVVRMALRGRLVLTRHALFSLRGINKYVLSNAVRVIAVSHAVAESLGRNDVIEPSKIIVVHNGVDPDAFKGLSARADGPILVGTVGHLAPIKGQDIFLCAAALVSALRSDVQFVIIGEDKSPEKKHRRSLEKLVAELDLDRIVTFAGWRDDMAAMLSSLDVFVSAARSEPFGLAIVEAMAAGLPVVTTASAGALEIIEDGVNGKLISAWDHHSLAAAISNLLRDPLERSRLGHNAKATVRERFSLARMARETERVYCEVLAVDKKT